MEPNYRTERREDHHSRPESKEEYVIVLDFLAHGKQLGGNSQPLAQVIGEKTFVLLEVVPKQDAFIKPQDRLYIGPEKREQVHHVLGRVNYNSLTPTAKTELPYVVERLVGEREPEFVNFFNKCGAVTTRQHQLELLPGIGKKHMWKIIEEREIEPFKSFEDIKERVDLLPDPKGLIVKRILLEIRGMDKYNLFTG